MLYLFFIALGIALAVFISHELKKLKIWGSAEFAKLSETLKRN